MGGRGRADLQLPHNRTAHATLRRLQCLPPPPPPPLPPPLPVRWWSFRRMLLGSSRCRRYEPQHPCTPVHQYSMHAARIISANRTDGTDSVVGGVQHRHAIRQHPQSRAQRSRAYAPEELLLPQPPVRERGHLYKRIALLKRYLVRLGRGVFVERSPRLGRCFSCGRLGVRFWKRARGTTTQHSAFEPACSGDGWGRNNSIIGLVIISHFLHFRIGVRASSKGCGVRGEAGVNVDRL